MKQVLLFCRKCLLFAITMTLISYLCNEYIIDKYKGKLQSWGGSDVYRAIAKSKKKTKVKKVIIGDSTANQFFDNRDDEDGYYSLASNQAIGICGIFFLLNNYLETGNRPEEVYLLYYPNSFKNNLNQIYTYHYFLKPFYKEEYKPLMTECLLSQIKKIPFYEFAQLPFIIGPAWAPDYCGYEEIDDFLSPISSEYLVKIFELKDKYHFDLYIVPTVVAECQKEQIASYDTTMTTNPSYGKALAIYLKNIQYLPDKLFNDGIHLSQPQNYKDSILRIMETVKDETTKLN